MQITWIRHGQTEENVKGTYYGQKEATLTPEGVRQIKLLRPLVEETLTIYISPSQRTIDTANILFGQNRQTGEKVKAVTDERLVERNMGKWEGLTYSEIEKQDPIACKAWEEDWINYTLPEGESARNQYDRVSSFIKMIEEKKEDATVVAHAGTIRMAIAYMLGENIELFWKFKIDTGV
ncbi:MAG: histidine phosphatase family protein, partial [Niameybacter sp.]